MVNDDELFVMRPEESRRASYVVRVTEHLCPMAHYCLESAHMARYHAGWEHHARWDIAPGWV